MTERQAVTHVRVKIYNIARRLLGNHGIHYSRQSVSKENRETFCGSVNGRATYSRCTIFNSRDSSINFSSRHANLFSSKGLFRSYLILDGKHKFLSNNISSNNNGRHQEQLIEDFTATLLSSSYVRSRAWYTSVDNASVNSP